MILVVFKYTIVNYMIIMFSCRVLVGYSRVLFAVFNPKIWMTSTKYSLDNLN